MSQCPLSRLNTYEMQENTFESWADFYELSTAVLPFIVPYGFSTNICTEKNVAFCSASTDPERYNFYPECFSWASR